MGFRFQKRIQILPGLRLNLSKSGASFSVGPQGASISVGKRGVYGNVGIPGTGLSWRERLDKPSGRTSRPQVEPANPDPQLPERVLARLVDDRIQLLDGNEIPLDPQLIPLAQRLMKDDIRSFLDTHVEERNRAIDALRHLHHDIPREMRQTGIAGKPDRSTFSSQQAYTEALMTWRAQVANGEVDSESICDDLLTHLGALAWPAETNIAISLESSRLLLDVDLPEIDAMPPFTWKADYSAMALSQKPVAQKSIADLYYDHVCSIIIRLIGHAMAASSAITTVGVSAYTQRSSATGHLDDEYVATIEVTRAKWLEVNINQIDSVDARNLMRHLGAKIEANGRGSLLIQAPLS